MNRLGNIKQLIVNIDKPMTMELDMDINMLNLYVGKNGSGKSLILKLIWALTAAVALFIKGIPNKEIIVDYVFNNTFSNNDFNGSLSAVFENGRIDIQMEHGEAKQCIINLNSSVTDADIPVFLSTSTRTFDDLTKFIQFKSLTNGDETKLLEVYKLYDVIFVERFNNRLSFVIHVDDELKQRFESFELTSYGFKSFYLKDDKYFFDTEDGQTRLLTSLSKGEQSLLVMFLASY